MEENLEHANSEKNTRKHNSKALWLLVFVVTIFISSTFGAVFGFMAGGLSRKILPGIFQNALEKTRVVPAQNDKEIIRQRVVEEDSAVIDVVEKSSPAVVSIIVSKDVSRVQDFFSDPFDFPGFLNPFEGRRNGENNGTEKKKIGGGSGFIVTGDGIIVTNKHVVEDAGAEYTVITNDDKEHAAKVLAKDPVNDIALVKIDGENFPTLSMGDSDALKIGQTAIAIGNSLGEFSNTVSKGIISGLKRNDGQRSIWRIGKLKKYYPDGRGDQPWKFRRSVTEYYWGSYRGQCGGGAGGGKYRICYSCKSD